jgi:hypothetical protein
MIRRQHITSVIIVMNIVQKVYTALYYLKMQLTQFFENVTSCTSIL